jgi:hypothetical protein
VRALVACEFSGVVRDELAKLGWDAWSCDLLPSERLGQHIQGDVRPILAQPWDLVIAHPPCTHLAVSGARWFKDRLPEQDAALGFFLRCLKANAPMVAVENPIGVVSSFIRTPDQIVHPWWFGDPESKATCWWLKGLPKLVPTNVVNGRKPRVHYESPGPDRWMRRSRTLPKSAEAMARQWGGATVHQTSGHMPPRPVGSTESEDANPPNMEMDL